MGFSAKMEARSGVWLLLLLSIGVFVQAAPSGDLLERLDNHDLDALVEIDEEQPEKADAAQERKAPIDDLAKQAKQANEEERDRKDSKDPYKQRKTYTKAMKKYEKRTKWEKEHPVVETGRRENLIHSTTSRIQAMSARGLQRLQRTFIGLLRSLLPRRQHCLL